MCLHRSHSGRTGGICHLSGIPWYRLPGAFCPTSKVETMTGSKSRSFSYQENRIGVGTGVTVTFPPGEFEMQPDTINAASTSKVQVPVRTKGISFIHALFLARNCFMKHLLIY